VLNFIQVNPIRLTEVRFRIEERSSSVEFHDSIIWLRLYLSPK
jgi:hypothetical protein